MTSPLVPGALNFRDVGGLRAGDGTTRSGILYRSGQLARLDDSGRGAHEGPGSSLETMGPTRWWVVHRGIKPKDKGLIN